MKPKKDNPKQTLLIVGIVLLLLMPQLLIPAALVYLVIYLSKKKKSSASSASIQEDLKSTFSSLVENEPHPSRDTSDSEVNYTTYAKKDYEECPTLFCHHKDKGEHHLKHGKEIDPWDRPDIDISRYQHRQ